MQPLQPSQNPNTRQNFSRPAIIEFSLHHDIRNTGPDTKITYIEESNCKINTSLNERSVSSELSGIVEFAFDAKVNLGNISPYHFPAISGNVRILEAALQNIDINVKDQNGFTPLHYAVLFGHVDCVKMLLNKGADKNEKIIGGLTPMHLKMYNPYTNPLAAINDKFNGLTPLALIAKCSTPKVLNDFIKKLKLIVFLDSKSISRHSKEEELVFNNIVTRCYANIVQLLIGAGATINELDEDNLTPLHNAVRTGNFEVVKTLLEHGALGGTNVNSTILHTAIDFYNKNNKIFSLLLQHGANTNIQNAAGFTPLHKVIRTNNSYAGQALLAYGANPEISDYRGVLPLGLASEYHKKNWENMISYYKGTLSSVSATTNNKKHMLGMVSDQDFFMTHHEGMDLHEAKRSRQETSLITHQSDLGTTNVDSGYVISHTISLFDQLPVPSNDYSPLVVQDGMPVNDGLNESYTTVPDHETLFDIPFVELSPLYVYGDDLANDDLSESHTTTSGSSAPLEKAPLSFEDLINLGDFEGVKEFLEMSFDLNVNDLRKALMLAAKIGNNEIWVLIHNQIEQLVRIKKWQS